MKSNRKLRNFLIYPAFQIRLILMIMGISLVAPLTIFIFQLNLLREQKITGENLILPASHPYMVMNEMFQAQTFAIFLGSTALSIIICFILGVVISHRVAGPLVKLKKHFENVALDEKSDEKIFFRQGDFFKELAEAYNMKFEKNK